MVIADLALAMIEHLEKINRTFRQPMWIRIGIHAGPVIAGVIGIHKFVYDIWGNTVNLASRYESYSEPNKIHISKEVAERLEDRYLLSSRGIINMRGIGEVEGFFLTGRK
jgi:class 3 adenylate cyclase